MNLKERLEKIVSDNCKDSPTAFAEKIGISPGTYHSWDDIHIPKGNILLRILNEFNVNINWLLSGEGEPYIQPVGGTFSGRITDPGDQYGKTKIYDTPEGKVAVTTFTPSQAQFSNSPQKNSNIDVDRFGYAVSMLKEIFDSNDPVMIPALEANLKAFRLAVRRENIINTQQDEIKNLNTKCDEFEKRLENLETRLVQSQYHRKAASNAESSDE